jgi:hypothetical protein
MIIVSWKSFNNKIVDSDAITSVRVLLLLYLNLDQLDVNSVDIKSDI